MRIDKSETLERHMDSNRLNDRRHKLPSFYPPVIDERRKPKKGIVDKEIITDSLTATYWG